MVIRFLADADLKQHIVSGCLRIEPSMDFLSANDAGIHGLPDPDVLAVAAEQNRILVTHDFRTMPRHFGTFIESGQSCPGIFLVHQRTQLSSAIEAPVLIW